NLMSALAKADWGRFRYYSSRIQSVGVGQTVKTDLPPESAALVQMFHGPSSLLPNIKTISWRFIHNQNYMSILPFIGPQLEDLSLEMDEGIDNVAKLLLLQNLSHRVSTLESLRLTSPGFAHHISTPLSTLISSLPNLEHLELPSFFLTQEVVAAAARLPLLVECLSYSKWTKNAESYHESGMCFDFMPGSFPKLETLAFASLPNRMAEILQSPDHAGRLRLVMLDCPAYNSPQEVESVFAALGSGAQQLESVMLMCNPVPQLTPSSSKDSLSIETIRPLFSCTQIEEFHLYAPHFTPLKDEGVLEMARSWPAMWSLSLCPTPLVKRDLGVGFSILPLFAKSFPNLQVLGLFFGKGIPEFDGDLYPAYRFTKLETLELGISRIPKNKTRDIGFLFASLCQHPPSIGDTDIVELLVDESASNMSSAPVPVPGSADQAPGGGPLALEEILRLIFKFAEKAPLSRAARVSRAWSDIALQELWRSLPSIFPLLRLLAPLEWILEATSHHNVSFFGWYESCSLCPH
ncbi:hypothetical protein FRC00_012868, partial [Tulasnella sp. 408]